MYIFVLALGLVIYMVAIIQANRFKSKLDAEVLLDYEKIRRPRFIYYYIVGTMLPLMGIMLFLLNDPMVLMSYFWLIFIGILVIDVLVLARISFVLNESPFREQLSKFSIFFMFALLLSAAYLITLKLYFDDAIYNH